MDSLKHEDEAFFELFNMIHQSLSKQGLLQTIH